MAPLGEWSLEATVLDGARGMPGTVATRQRGPWTGYSCGRHLIVAPFGEPLGP
jgi:hypothetical protein